jgi:hypothetical protein
MKAFLLRRNVYLLVTVIVILAGTLVVIVSDGTVRAIASSVVASGFVSLFYLYAQYVEQENRIRTKALDDAGLVSLSPTRRAEYGGLVGDAKLNVDVLGYSLRSFADDHASVLTGKRPPFAARILVVGPDSEASANQERLERHQAGTFANGVDRLQSLFAGQEPLIQLRAIAHAPPSMMFRIDNVLFVGPFFSHEASAATSTLKLVAGGWLFTEYMAEFDKLWDEAKPLSE